MVSLSCSELAVDAQGTVPFRRDDVLDKLPDDAAFADVVKAYDNRDKEALLPIRLYPRSINSTLPLRTKLSLPVANLPKTTENHSAPGPLLLVRKASPEILCRCGLYAKLKARNGKSTNSRGYLHHRFICRPDMDKILLPIWFNF